MAETGRLDHYSDRDGGRLRLRTGNENLLVWAGPTSIDNLCGILGVYRDGALVAQLYATPGGEGRLLLSGGLGETGVVDIGAGPFFPGRYGYLRLNTSYPRGEGKHTIAQLGPVGDDSQINVFRGLLRLYDNGNSRVRLGVDDSGGYLELRSQGSGWVRIDSVLKHFVVANPTDANSEIYYSAMEGPEAGLYVRGSLSLRRGGGQVKLPEYFSTIVEPLSLTVQLTARSIRSRGVAATRLTRTKLAVRELRQGKGNYRVDYVVHGVRRGYSGYKAVRPRRQAPE